MTEFENVQNIKKFAENSKLNASVFLEIPKYYRNIKKCVKILLKTLNIIKNI